MIVKPYPIIAPGSITIEIAVRIKEDVVRPLKVRLSDRVFYVDDNQLSFSVFQAELSLYKKVLFGSVSVPCMSGIGSCTYDDLCDSCPQCGCPLKMVRATMRGILITIEYVF